MSLAVRDVELEELMDDPACDPRRLRATLRRFGTINRLFSGWGFAYRVHLAPHIASLGRPARVLDLGSGGGDVVLRLARLAAKEGLDVAWTGVDPDPRSHEVAIGREAPSNVRFRLADAATLPQIIFSSTYDLRSTTDEAFRDAGLMPEVVLEGAEMDAVLRFVERGLGVAIVPAMVLIDRPGLRSVRLEEPTLTRTISLARPSDVAPTAAVDVMQGTIAAVAKAFAGRAGDTMRLADPAR